MVNNTFIGDTAGSVKRPLKGLSCLLGNWHGQFLEGLGLVTAPGYSAFVFASYWYAEQIKSNQIKSNQIKSNQCYLTGLI